MLVCLVENPAWREALAEYVEVGADGSVRLNIDSALQLAHVHSPSHQNQLETLQSSDSRHDLIGPYKALGKPEKPEEWRAKPLHTEAVEEREVAIIMSRKKPWFIR